AGPQDDVLGEAREVNRHQSGDAAKFNGKIPVADAVHGILREARLAFFVDKLEEGGDECAIDRQSRASNSAVAQRANVDAIKAIVQALIVEIEHFDVGEHVMGEENRL